MPLGYRMSTEKFDIDRQRIRWDCVANTNKAAELHFWERINSFRIHIHSNLSCLKEKIWYSDDVVIFREYDNIGECFSLLIWLIFDINWPVNIILFLICLFFSIFKMLENLFYFGLKVPSHVRMYHCTFFSILWTSPFSVTEF